MDVSDVVVVIVVVVVGVEVVMVVVVVLEVELMDDHVCFITYHRIDFSYQS